MTFSHWADLFREPFYLFFTSWNDEELLLPPNGNVSQGHRPMMALRNNWFLLTRQSPLHDTKSLIENIFRITSLSFSDFSRKQTTTVSTWLTCAPSCWATSSRWRSTNSSVFSLAFSYCKSLLREVMFCSRDFPLIYRMLRTDVWWNLFLICW
jgi:hypothetical protein